MQNKVLLISRFHKPISMSFSEFFYRKFMRSEMSHGSWVNPLRDIDRHQLHENEMIQRFLEMENLEGIIMAKRRRRPNIDTLLGSAESIRMQKRMDEAWAKWRKAMEDAPTMEQMLAEIKGQLLTKSKPRWYISEACRKTLRAVIGTTPVFNLN